MPHVDARGRPRLHAQGRVLGCFCPLSVAETCGCDVGGEAGIGHKRLRLMALRYREMGGEIILSRGRLVIKVLR